MATRIATDKAPAAIGPYSQGWYTEDTVYVSGQLALKSVLEKENVETEGMLLDEKYFPCRFSVAYGAAGKRHHALCDSSSERKRKYYFI